MNTMDMTDEQSILMFGTFFNLTFRKRFTHCTNLVLYKYAARIATVRSPTCCFLYLCYERRSLFGFGFFYYRQLGRLA